MNNSISFHKYHGTGNDFILIDSYNSDIQLSTDTIKAMCHRQFGIGSDGLMILRKKKGFDFEMDFYNSDGNRGSMCGNGGRCIVAFANNLNIIKEKAHFWAPDGEHTAIFHNQNKISLKMIDVHEIEQHKLGVFLNTGSPHLVIFKDIKTEINVVEEGKSIRYSDTYKEHGVNVNFVIPAKNNSQIYTYERGVENQTFSCGTGTVASAIALHKFNHFPSPISFKTLGGDLQVYFEHKINNNYQNIWLEGPAIEIFNGNFNF